MPHSNKSKAKPKPRKHNDSPALIVFDAIGTRWVIEIFESTDPAVLAKLKREVLQRIETYDQHYSRFRKDSLVTEMAAKPKTYTLPDDAKPLLDLYAQLYEISKGVVTPLIGNTLSDAGYDAGYSLQPKQLSSPLAWDDALKYEYPHVTIKQPVLLDFGAAGKGYLVDIVAELLLVSGVQSFCVNAGGDMYYRAASEEQLQVGLENPNDTSEVIGIASIYNQSLCGSAGNRRAWDKYHHIMNPITLQSPKHIKGLWVVADSGLVADGLATALFFVEPEVLIRHFTFEYAIVYEDSSLRKSTNFPAEFFMSQGTPP